MLRMIIILTLILLPVVSEGEISELQDAKNTALMVEEYLERLQVAVENACIKGEVSKDAWEQYCVIHWHASSILRVMVMAVLFYEEAPNESHRETIAASAFGLMDTLLMLDNFCNAVGIEVPPLTLPKEMADFMPSPGTSIA